MNKVKDIQCGLKSNIPYCCTIFFVTTWNDWEKVGDEAARDRYRAKIPERVEYVPCPECIKANRFSKTHLCGPKDYKACEVHWCSGSGYRK